MIYTFLHIADGGLRARATQVEAHCLTPHAAVRKRAESLGFVARKRQSVWRKGDMDMLWPHINLLDIFALRQILCRTSHGAAPDPHGRQPLLS
jgi:hypothetical protein